MKELILRISIASLLIIPFISCGDNSPTPSPIISEGAWSGTIMGESLTFTVEGSEVKNLQLIYLYDFTLVPDDTVTWTPDDASISSNVFSMSDSTSHDNYHFTLQIDGTFNPPNAVSGIFYTTFEYDSAGVHESGSDSLSWTGSHN
ncbi:MAG: hypothetical protein KAQ97_06795 [Candidatus Fermentibacteraceae bacterium]|nr:hypothetical protein [Candidatus Fermentibacteraceae bacterium]